MSGEAVLIPLVWESITGIAGAVESTIEARKEAARRQAEEERERIQAWRNLQSQRVEEQRRLQRSHEAVGRAHQRMLTLGLKDVATRSTGGPTSLGFVENPAAQNHEGSAIDLLGQIADEFGALPDELFADEHLPFMRLRTQWQRLHRANEPTIDEVLSFRDTLERTFDDYIKRIEHETEQLQKRFADAERLLTNILEARELSMDEKDDQELEQLEQRLITLLEGNCISPAALDIVKTRYYALRDKIERAISEDEMSDYLVQRVTHHLSELGYYTLENFSEKQPGRSRNAQFALPDGDRLHIALQPNLRMAFQLSHETGTAIKNTLSGEALAFFRQQETRWCGDMKELIRRLIRDGVPYEVQFEREVPTESIPVVVVETVDDLLDEEAAAPRRRKGKHKRHFT